MSDKSEIQNKIDALEFEREGYKTFGKDDRVKEVDAELKHWRTELKKASGSTPADDGEGVISEAEAAKQGPVDGEKIANARAAAHRKQKYAVADTPVIDEAEAAAEPKDAAEQAANERAEQLRTEPAAEGPEAHIVTEAEVVKQAEEDGELETDEPEGPEAKSSRGKRTTADSKPRSTRST